MPDVSEESKQPTELEQKTEEQVLRERIEILEQELTAQPKIEDRVTIVKQVYGDEQGEIRAQSADKKESEEVRKQQPATAGEDLSILQPRKLGGIKSKKRYKCDVCSKSFATETGRATHGKVVHSNNDLTQKHVTIGKQLKPVTEGEQVGVRSQPSDPITQLKMKAIADDKGSEASLIIIPYPYHNKEESEVRKQQRATVGEDLSKLCIAAICATETATAHHKATAHKKKIPQERQLGATKCQNRYACESSNISLASRSGRRPAPGGGDPQKGTLAQQQHGCKLRQDQGEVNYDCFFCGKLFSSNNERTSHIAMLHRRRKQQPATAGKDLFKGLFCSKSFRREIEMAKRQMAGASQSQKRYECEIYGDEQGEIRAQSADKKESERENEMAKRQVAGAAQSQKIDKLRDMCYKMFATENGRPHHRKVGHKKASEPFCAPVKYKAMSYERKSEMRIDQPSLGVCSLQSNLQYRCTLCNRSFPIAKRLILHRRMAHLTERHRTQCKFCGKVFVSTHKMLLHKRSEHKRSRKKGKKKPQYQCRRCLQRFWSKHKLHAHKRIAHKGQENT
eukprot:GHVN01107167.1.p1 GENE.GHVN01107167.1~~GHVN01107167.1.p1  ORF type:complete len:565 (+),score=87.05 GHVN01107167.1:1252-2946(+)